MTEPSIDEIRAGLDRVARMGEVFPSAARSEVIRAGWTGRFVDVLGVIAADPERMRFIAGGDSPDEIADAVECWAVTSLDPDELELVFSAGGYDPDPFVVLKEAGMLRAALLDDEGGLRRIDGERAGMWISDQLASANALETVEEVRRRLDAGRHSVAS